MSTKTVLIYIFILIIMVVGAAFLFSGNQKPTPTNAAYSATDSDRPIAQVSERFFDVGDLKLSDVKVQDFTLTNGGTKPLQILNVNTSCGCTAGQIIYKGETSKEFGMHKQSGFVTEIAPGDSATVRLTYRPATMPVNGLVTREVYVTTNDPQNSKLSFSIQARVN